MLAKNSILLFNKVLILFLKVIQTQCYRIKIDLKNQIILIY